MKSRSLLLLAAALLSVCAAAARPARKAKSIYHDGWTDFNKNGRMDVW